MSLTAEAQRYEQNVTETLDHRLPPHAPNCDEAWTSGVCLRCDVMAGIEVAFGFARSIRPERTERARRENA